MVVISIYRRDKLFGIPTYFYCNSQLQYILLSVSSVCLSVLKVCIAYGAMYSFVRVSSFVCVVCIVSLFVG